MIQLTKEQALEIAESGVWKNWTDEEVTKFQLYQDRLCMDFSRFHESVEKTLGRPVYTHEFAFPEHLQKEFEGDKEPPTLMEVLNLFPKDKPIIIVGAEC
ncbi:MAG: hypothetical protein V1769_00070 [Thermoplasmatota archaeon]